MTERYSKCFSYYSKCEFRIIYFQLPIVFLLKRTWNKKWFSQCTFTNNLFHSWEGNRFFYHILYKCIHQHDKSGCIAIIVYLCHTSFACHLFTFHDGSLTIISEWNGSARHLGGQPVVVKTQPAFDRLVIKWN